MLRNMNCVNGNSGLSYNNSHSNYEELVSGVKCPTCNGLGKVSQDSEQEYIALIPLSDSRLRPRRTKLWIGVTVFVCLLVLVATSSTLFFLVPRSIRIYSDKPVVYPLSVKTRDEVQMIMQIQNVVNISNDNYFPISVTKIELEAFHLSTSIGQNSSRPNGLVIGPRSHHMLSAMVTCEIADILFIFYCNFNKEEEHFTELKFAFTITSEYLFDHTEEATLSVYQIVDCTNTNTTTTATTTTPAPPTTKPSVIPYVINTTTLGSK